MSFDVPCVSHMALYIISLHILQSNSRTSSQHWRLDPEEGKVVQSKDDGDVAKKDPYLNILTKRSLSSNGEWKVEATADIYKQNTPDEQMHDNRGNDSSDQELQDLTCGKPVNYTQYDHLRGITNRDTHIHIPEPEVALTFRKKGSKRSEVDINELHERLKKLKNKKPRSSHLYSQIGNFWRIKGNTQMSIECFRKALYISPNNPEVLLNLARVLFNLQYLDDAIFLTRRSLILQSENQNSWLQHYTLGEILKAYGHYQEATLHFQYALDLNPGFHPAEVHLLEMEGIPNPSVTQYTCFIILFLIFGVLFGVLTSVDSNFDDSADSVKMHRHFNRAMAMKSIKLGLNPRLIRMRKMQC